jgi:hypothetical protein
MAFSWQLKQKISKKQQNAQKAKLRFVHSADCFSDTIRGFSDGKGGRASRHGR